MQFQLQWHLCHARQPLDFRNKKFNTAVGLIDNVPTRKHEQKKQNFVSTENSSFLEGKVSFMDYEEMFFLSSISAL